MGVPDITQLKNEHGVLFSVEIGDTTFIFKQLSLREYAVVDGADVSPE